MTTARVAKPTRFLSTPSARRATGLGLAGHGERQISIHALREEGDESGTDRLMRRSHFYPRPPRGGRPTRIELEARDYPFLSTPSARRATVPVIGPGFLVTISIHALREEGDANCPGNQYEPEYISIHALREEGDSKNREKTLCFCLIIHLPAQIAKRCM